jgi:hypothetical protein
LLTNTVENTVHSADGAWVKMKVERDGPKTIGASKSGGEMDFQIKVRQKVRVTMKGRNDADPKVLTSLVRERMKDLLGSAPLAMPFSYASGLITFTWEGESGVSEAHLLQGLCDAIELANVKSAKSQQAELSEAAPHLMAKTESSGVDWMSDSLATAKGIITRFHVYCVCEPETFFRATTYDLFIQENRPNAYGYITTASGARHFPIGIHPILKEPTPYNQRALTVVLVHELLHAIHPEWGHDKIIPQEKLLANKAGYFDALVELQRMAVSGKMRFCGEGDH